MDKKFPAVLQKPAQKVAKLGFERRVALGQPIADGKIDRAPMRLDLPVILQRRFPALVGAADGKHDGENNGGGDQRQRKIGDQPKLPAGQHRHDRQPGNQQGFEIDNRGNAL